MCFVRRKGVGINGMRQIGGNNLGNENKIGKRLGREWEGSFGLQTGPKPSCPNVSFKIQLNQLHSNLIPQTAPIKVFGRRA